MLSWSILFLLSEWVIRVVMLLIIVTRRREPSAAVAWLLVIFFEPWLGAVLYLLIGENRLPRRRISEHAQLLEELKTIRRRFENHPDMTRPALSPEQAMAVTLAEHLGYMPILGGNQVELMSRNEEVIERLIADIRAAEQHVHLLFYIYADDATGRRVAEALFAAAARGVRCRVLVDAVGSRTMFKRMAPAMRAQGIEVFRALPASLFRRRMARLDLRNHRKLAVIDGRVAYTGSQNLVNADYGRRDLAWHDMMVRITGPVVLELQAVFVSDWYFETDEILDSQDIFPEPIRAGRVAAQTLPSGPSYPTENYQRMVVAALHAARRRVTITTPYFVPDEPFMQAMEVAVLRGVEVELVVPQRFDQILVGAATRAFYDDLLAAGVSVYLYQPGLVHAKTMSIDDAWAMIGTSNFDIRSFALNFEINMVFFGVEVAEQLRARQQEYIEQSVRLSAAQWQRRPRRQRMGQYIARLLAPLL